jgi:hypothetical protein
VRWSVDRLNAIDRSTAEALPTLERTLKDKVTAVAVAMKREYLDQFPPLEVNPKPVALSRKTP